MSGVQHVTATGTFSVIALSPVKIFPTASTGSGSGATGAENIAHVNCEILSFYLTSQLCIILNYKLKLNFNLTSI